MMANKSIRKYAEKAAGNETVKVFFHRYTGWVGMGIMGAFLIIAVIAPYIAPYKPDVINESIRLSPPSAAHWFGTDSYGRDVLSRILYGTRIDMSIAFLSVTLGYVFGVIAGLVAGYFGKVSDSAIMRSMDIILSIPFLILAIAIALILGKGFTSIIVAVSVVSIPTFARVTRSSVLSTRQELFVTGAISIGANRWHILRHHVLPNTVSPTLVLYALNLGFAIQTAAALSFLGAGVPPPTPEWGAIITGGLQYIITGQWWVSFIPGVFLTLAVIGFNMMGDTLREAMDVTLRR